MTADALVDRLSISQERHAGKEDYAELNNLASPLQSVKDAFSLMPTATASDWEEIVGRMGNVPRALKQYTQSLAYAAESGMVAARRQVEIGIKQSVSIGTPGSSGAFFEKLAQDCPADIAAKVGNDRLENAVRAASQGYLWLAGWLKEN